MGHDSAHGSVTESAAILLSLLAAAVLTPCISAAPPVQQWPGPYPGIKYQELLPLVNSTSMFLLDVRNRSELLSPGRLPHSLNLPLPELASALQLSEEEFSQKYGFTLPSPQENEMILLCRSGRRIQVAAKLLIAAGFNNLRLYYGSFKEWAKNGAPISRLLTKEESIAFLQALDRSEIAQWKDTVVDVRSGVNRNTIPGAIELPNLTRTQPSRRKPVVLIGSNMQDLLDALPKLNRMAYYRLRLFVY